MDTAGPPDTSALPPTGPWAERADEAARSVVQTFGRELLGLPGTHLAARRYPAPPRRDLAWNYWWQAHYLDALVDAGLRHLHEGGVAAARAYLRLGRELLRAVWLRNVAHYTNGFFDDMAWMILAAGRLDALARDLGEAPPRASRRLAARIAPKLRRAETEELGGGLYWTRRRDRKNVPATAPAAIYFARTGDVDRARRLVEWIYATLWDETEGLALDTAYCDGRLDRTVYTYNQGTLLGALLALGDEVSLARAAALVASVDAALRAPAERPVLRTHGDGDGGLFTGILVRYLTLAAAEPRLPDDVRRVAAALVAGTAQALWEGSEVRRLGAPARVFSPDPGRPAAETLPGGATLDMSPQLQAWTVLEAAARCPALPSA